MSPPSPAPEPESSPAGWGILVALLVFAGTIGGSLVGQVSIGFLGGLALGCLIALGFWLRDRRNGPRI